MTDEEVSDLWRSARNIGKVVEREYKATSLSFAIQDGPQAGQTVPHAHVHIIPRRFGDWANNDDIYEELDDSRKKKGVDNEEREPRSLEEMANEAKWLSQFFQESG
ncbi:hypothetical protein BZG36_03615 [Bifiguratus adelaidae]|uniref:HIT domain-containing protein n=1 Tax=Bifiguratus adelaidae TaxID=1938954 RepID=A0A261Y000_9FUNG|nr:hypothetical protein BZG36_03615 [Bifiguratus adelaidae]